MKGILIFILARSVLPYDWFTSAGRIFLSSQKHCGGSCCGLTSRTTHTRSHYNLLEYQGPFFLNFCSRTNLRNREKRGMVVLTARVFCVASDLSTGKQLPTF